MFESMYKYLCFESMYTFKLFVNVYCFMIDLLTDNIVWSVICLKVRVYGANTHFRVMTRSTPFVTLSVQEKVKLHDYHQRRVQNSIIGNMAAVNEPYLFTNYRELL